MNIISFFIFFSLFVSAQLTMRCTKLFYSENVNVPADALFTQKD